MGYGNYSAEAHERLVASRIDRPREAVFRQASCHPLLDPKGVAARESRDSAAHPRSLPIAFALDVTGSMGIIPDALARRELPKFCAVLRACGVEDAQIAFLAVGDAFSDRSPLQVGQFESEAELIDRWLTYLHLEGGGGGGREESYELAMYFLAEHTELDALRRRGQRGYAFFTGDEAPYPKLSRHVVEAVLGDHLDEDVAVEDVLGALAASFHPFFLVPDLERRRPVERRLRALFGDHLLGLESPDDTCHVAAGAVVLTEGLVTDLDAYARTLLDAGVPGARVGAVVRALGPYAAALGREGPLPTAHPVSALVPDGPPRAIHRPSPR